jgi:hypothetical protein
MRENNDRDEANQDTLYAYVEMSQQKPLCNYYIFKTIFKKNGKCLRDRYV